MCLPTNPGQFLPRPSHSCPTVSPTQLSRQPCGPQDNIKIPPASPHHHLGYFHFGITSLSEPQTWNQRGGQCSHRGIMLLRKDAILGSCRIHTGPRAVLASSANSPDPGLTPPNMLASRGRRGRQQCWGQGRRPGKRLQGTGGHAHSNWEWDGVPWAPRSSPYPLCPHQWL